MTAIAQHPVPAGSGSGALHLIRGEYLKIRTTNTWWIFGLATVGTTVVALLFNFLQAHLYLTQQPPQGADQQTVQQYALNHNVVSQAANIFTSGQYFGAMFMMLLAILMITNEYYHQTVTTTFLATPHRSAVVLAKLVTAMLAAVYFWLITTVLSLIGGSIYFSVEGFASHLGDWPVIRAILINLVVFALWGVFGVGIGVLMRSQLGATITAALLYVVGSQIAQLGFFLIRQYVIHRDGVYTAMVLLPSIAGQVAVSPTKTFPESPPEWVGAAVLIGYGVLLGTVGTFTMRRRDIS